MKLETKLAHVEKSSIVETKRFTMRADGNLFRSIIRLYSNSIHALLREGGTNALDSHIQAGKPNEPFKVCLPTTLDPTFRIIDNGVGLSKQEIDELYSVAGLSSKSDSNSYCGAFGLGRLSFLAYSSQFGLISRHNGERHSYIVALDEGNCPSLNYLGSEKTDECNGLEVNVGVKTTDIRTFAVEAKNVYQYFPVKPIITGAAVNFQDFTYLYTEPTFKIKEGAGQAVVVMGAIAYVINPHNLGLQSYSDDANILNQAGLEFHLPIGSIDITPSRDAIEYTDKSKTAIKEALKTVKEFMKVQIEKELVAAKNLWEARLLYQKITGKLAQFVRGLSLTWNGKDVSGRHIDLGYKVGAPMYEKWNFCCFSYYRSKTQRPTSITVTKNVDFVYNDLDKGGIARARLHRDSAGLSDVYVIGDQETKRHIIKECGFDDSYIKLVSSLPAPPKEIRAKRESGKFEWFHPADQATDKKEIKDITKGDYIYVNLYFNDIQDGEGKDIIDFFDIRRKLRDLGIKLPEIIGVRPHKKERIGKLSNWKCFRRWAIEQLEGYIKKEGIDQAFGAAEALEALKQKDNYKEWKKVAEQHPRSDLAKFLEKVEDTKKLVTSKLTNTTRLASYLGFKLKLNPIDLASKEKELIEKYTILKVQLPWTTEQQQSWRECLDFYLQNK